MNVAYARQDRECHHVMRSECHHVMRSERQPLTDIDLYCLHGRAWLVLLYAKDGLERPPRERVW